jgi:hypothetical protein
MASLQVIETAGVCAGGGATDAAAAAGGVTAGGGTSGGAVGCPQLAKGGGLAPSEYRTDGALAFEAWRGITKALENKEQQSSAKSKERNSEQYIIGTGDFVGSLTISYNKHRGNGDAMSIQVDD